MSGHPAIFLDRDGTIIEDQHYPRDPNAVVLTPGAANAMKAFEAMGYWIFVVSNQSGVGRGIISDDEFRAVHDRFTQLLREENVQVAEFAYCFHTPEDACKCRKPGTGLVPRVFKGQAIDWAKSIVVGDKSADIQLASKMGARGILVRTGHGETTLSEWDKDLPLPEVFTDLSAVAEDLRSK